MTWESRLIPAGFTPPDGTRKIPFAYEDLKKSFVKKGSSFTFPDADGTYVQDFGSASDKFPLRAIFHGKNCDLEAEVFEEAVRQQGVGRLDHPMYGTRNVVAIGEVIRRDDLTTAANQVIVELVFWETVGFIYPNAQNDPVATAEEALTIFGEDAATDLKNKLDNADKVSFRSNYTALLDTVKGGLEKVAEFNDGVKNRFDAISNSIDQGIDALIDDPLTLAFQTLLLIQTPARAGSLIKDRLDAYKNLLDFIVNGGNTSSPEAFIAADLMSTMVVSSMAVSVIEHEFDTRGSALSSAEFIVSQMSALNEWREQGYIDTNQTDTGSVYQSLQQAIALTAGFLVEISFTLRQERRITLNRNRTIVDLVAELYGSVDDQLDFFINTNNLSGSEILELPAGKEILYYV